MIWVALLYFVGRLATLHRTVHTSALIASSQPPQQTQFAGICRPVGIEKCVNQFLLFHHRLVDRMGNLLLNPDTEFALPLTTTCVQVCVCGCVDAICLHVRTLYYMFRGPKTPILTINAIIAMLRCSVKPLETATSQQQQNTVLRIYKD